jgi:glycosyltransferase involved in cell wall biosynthesis
MERLPPFSTVIITSMKRKHSRKSLPRISIVIPSFNQGIFIARTLESLRKQNYPDLEIIVMDGGSTDRTVPILKKFDRFARWSRNIRFYWRSEKDRGQTHAINKGLRETTGKILAYLNSDDTYEPGALLTVGKYCVEYPRAQFVYGRGQLIDADDNVVGKYNDSQATTASLHHGCVISQPTAFWSRKLCKKIGPFDESFHFTMDYEYWVRVSKHFKMAFLPQTLANTRLHPSAKTSSATQRLYGDAIRVQLRHYPFVHHDWIFTFADGLVHTWKDGNILQEAWYWVVLFTGSAWLQLWWNGRVPSRPMWRQYGLWVKECAQRFGGRFRRMFR